MSVSTHIYSYPDVGVALKMDVYFASPSQVARNPVPTVVFFHGGSLIAGNREVLSKDVKRDTLSRGWCFISADYRLLIPSTGHEILTDVKSLFGFIADPTRGLNKELRALGCLHEIDPDRLFVGGCSAGAYPAMLAALFAQPKPKGFFSFYGMGGDLLTKDYLPRLEDSETTPTRDERVKPQYSAMTIEEAIEEYPEVARFFAPTPEDTRNLRPVSDVPNTYAPRVILGGRPGNASSASSPVSSRSTSSSSRSSVSDSTTSGTIVTTDLIPGTNVPGHRARISGQLPLAMKRTGKFLDYLTGDHTLSAQLSEAEDHEARCALMAQNEKVKYLFPQIWVDKSFPPSIIIHGDEDRVVDINESRRLVEKLDECEVPVTFLVAEGKGHQFEERASPEVYVKFVKPVVQFLNKLY